MEAEVRAAREAGLPAEFTEDVPLPFPTAGAIRLDDQAEFHPVKYLRALVGAFLAAGGSVFEHSRATAATQGSPCTVSAGAGEVRADDVVLATHAPFLDRSLRVRPHPRGALLLHRASPSRPSCVDGMFINTGADATRSIRSHPFGDGELLIVGGEGHKTGKGGDTRQRYRRLEAFARERFGTGPPRFRWSSQDLMPADGMPYVGPVNPISPRVQMATGSRKWGLTNGTAAAMMLADSILGRENTWAPTFASNRMKPKAAARDLITENLDARATLRRRPHRACRRTLDRRARARRSSDSRRGAARRSRPTATRTVSSTRSRRTARISAVASPGTRPSAAGTARATARASVPTARCSRAPRCTTCAA